jgi:hypothetical protein
MIHLKEMEKALWQGLEFDEELHSYTYQGKKLISCTQLLGEMGITKSYKEIEHLPAVHKAREKGVKIHDEIHKYFTSTPDTSKFTPETRRFIEWWTHKASFDEDILTEQMLCDKDNMIAGTVDIAWEDKKTGNLVIGDFKTARHVDLWQAAWQLAVYRYLFNKFFTHIMWPKQYTLLVFSFKYNVETEKAFMEVEDVSTYVDPKDVERLVEAYHLDEPFEASTMVSSEKETNLAVKASKIMLEIEAMTNHLKTLKDELSNVKSHLHVAMSDRKVKVLKLKDTGSYNVLTMTRVDSFWRKSLDSARLKEENPALYDRYAKLTNVAPTVRISMKEERNEEDPDITNGNYEYSLT